MLFKARNRHAELVRSMGTSQLMCCGRELHIRLYNSLRQASPSGATMQLMPTPRGRRPPPTQGGGSGLPYHVFRGAMTGRYLAS